MASDGTPAQNEQHVSYQGNCHCGGWRFELQVPEIKAAVSCNCLHCYKKGFLWLVPPPGSYRVVRDDGQLAEYESSTLRDKFCRICITPVLGEHLNGPLKGKLAVNVRTIQGVNPFKLEITPITTYQDQEQRPSLPALPPPSSDQPTAKHTASCRCGIVRTELLIPIEDAEVKEDNCSSCVRLGYIGTYPTKDQVRIHGREHTFEWLRGGGTGAAVACKTCGVHMFGNVYGPPITVFDKLPPERKEAVLKIYWKNMSLQPLSVRTFDDVDVSKLKYEPNDCGTDGYVLED